MRFYEFVARTYPYLLSHRVYSGSQELSLKVRAPWPPQRKSTQGKRAQQSVWEAWHPGELVRPTAVHPEQVATEAGTLGSQRRGLQGCSADWELVSGRNMATVRSHSCADCAVPPAPGMRPATRLCSGVHALRWPRIPGDEPCTAEEWHRGQPAVQRTELGSDADTVGSEAPG